MNKVDVSFESAGIRIAADLYIPSGAADRPFPRSSWGIRAPA
ncbi:hypothetical protein ACIA5D_25495 [Actinoplanes sp. NPDC051513]